MYSHLLDVLVNYYIDHMDQMSDFSYIMCLPIKNNLYSIQQRKQCQFYRILLHLFSTTIQYLFSIKI